VAKPNRRGIVAASHCGLFTEKFAIGNQKIGAFFTFEQTFLTPVS